MHTYILHIKSVDGDWKTVDIEYPTEESAYNAGDVLMEIEPRQYVDYFVDEV